MTPLRLLVLSPYPPSLEARHGGARVVAEIAWRLAETDLVALAYLRGAGEPPPDPRLLERCRHVVEVARSASHPGRERGRLRRLGRAARGVPSWVAEWASPELERRLRDLSEEWRPDVAHVHYQVMGQYLGSLGPGVASVLVAPEPATMRAAAAAREARGLAKLSRRLDYLAWRRFERRLLFAVDAVVVLTPRDREELERLGVATPVSVIPIGVSMPAHPSSRLGSDELVLFFGNFAHGPNVDAALRLTDRILPRLLTVRPQARLQIVGPHAPAALESRAGERVVVTGEVPDLAPYLDRAGVVAAPLRLGGGMRLKVVEALAAGKAVVASPLAAEGLAVSDGRELRLAETDEQFATVIAELLTSPSRREALAERARQFAAEQLGWEQRIDDYRRLHASLVTGETGSPAAAESDHQRVTGEAPEPGATLPPASVPSSEQGTPERG